MTPREKTFQTPPKPLTEKAIENIRTARAEFYGNRGLSYDCLRQAHDDMKSLIKELKHTREEVKILRDALNLEKQKAEFYGHRYYYSGESMPNSQARDLFTAICERTNDAIKDADEIKEEKKENEK